MRQQWANNASSTLSVAAAIGDTSITLTDASKFPASGNFTVLCDSEVMLVTARSGNVLTVRRAQEGTAAAAHSLGITASQILTAGSIDRWLLDSVPGAGSGSSRPPFALLDSAGNALTSASFGVVNLSTSTISDVDGSVLLKKPGNATVGENITALTRAKPAAPCTLTTGLRVNLPRDRTSGYPIAFVGFRESGTGKLMFAHVVNAGGGPNFQAAKYTNETTQNTIIVAAHEWVFASDTIWFQAKDDGTNLSLGISVDGVNFITLWTEARAAWFAAGGDQWCMGSNNSGNGMDNLANLVAWKEG